MYNVPKGAPKDLSDCRKFFLEPDNPKQRMYEALRAYFIDDRPSSEVARAFGYTTGSFQVLCHHFRRESDPVFFTSTRPGPRSQPKKSAARDLIIELRKQNHSVYEISEALKEQKCPLSPTAVREVLKEEGFAPLPRRLDAERPDRPRPTVEPIADVRNLSLAPRTFTTRCGGLFLFVPDLVRLKLDQLAQSTHMPGSKMIPAEQALRSCLALKLWSIERHSPIMASIRSSNAITYRRAAAASPASWFSWPRTPRAAPSVIPMPTCAKATRPMRSSTLFPSGSALTASSPAIWCLIPASPPTRIWRGWTRWGFPLSLFGGGLLL